MRYFYFLSGILLLSCQTGVKYPEGGFAYPKNISPKDTNQYLYPLKDSGTKQQAFQYYYGYLYYRAFDEPNLSIKPQTNETFRFVYSQARGKDYIISFTKDSLIVKNGYSNAHYEQDTSRLSAIENLHLQILQRRFPIGEKIIKSPAAKRNLDSIVKLYPELLDESYYHKLYEKALVTNESSFSYSEKRIAITKQQFISLVNDINSSGFWSLPYQINTGCEMADGYGFSLEANTKDRFKFVTVQGCPDDTTRFTKACQKIVEAAGLNKEINLLWKFEIIQVNPVELEPIQSPKKRKSKS